IRSGLTTDPSTRPELGEFAAALRGSLNQLLADSLAMPKGATSRPTAPSVHITVARRGADGRYTPLAARGRAIPRLTRYLEWVPPEPEGVGLRTGDRVRIEAVADRAGYLTVFTVGPTGHLTLLYPSRGEATAVAANQPVFIGNVEATPPAGSERI